MTLVRVEILTRYMPTFCILSLTSSHLHLQYTTSRELKQQTRALWWVKISIVNSNGKNLCDIIALIYALFYSMFISALHNSVVATAAVWRNCGDWTCERFQAEVSVLPLPQGHQRGQYVLQFYIRHDIVLYCYIINDIFLRLVKPFKKIGVNKGFEPFRQLVLSWVPLFYYPSNGKYMVVVLKYPPYRTLLFYQLFLLVYR